MCANPMHEGCGGCDYPDERPRCGGCREVTSECCCEDVTVDAPTLDVAAVSEAEAVRRQFRDELVKVLRMASEQGNLAATAGHRYAAESGVYEGRIQSVLIRLCGMSAAEVMAAAKGGAR